MYSIASLQTIVCRSTRERDTFIMQLSLNHKPYECASCNKAKIIDSPKCDCGSREYRDETSINSLNAADIIAI